MPGIVLLDDLTVLGDGDLINRLITIIPRPAGALQNTVGTIGQTLGGAFSVLADGDDVPFCLFCSIIAPSGFQIYGERGTFLRLLVPGDGIQRVLGELDFAVDHGIADRHRKAIFLLAVMVIAGFQLVHGFIQLVASGRFRFLEGVNSIVSRAWEQIRGETAVGDGIRCNRFSGLVQGVLRAVQCGIALGG